MNRIRNKYRGMARLSRSKMKLVRLFVKPALPSLPYHTEAGCVGKAVLMCFFDLGQQHSSVMTDRLNVEN